MARGSIASLVLVGCLTLAAGGCGGSERGAVRGRVTVNDEYRIDAARGPVAGEYRVQISAFRKTGKKVWDGMGDENAPASRKNYVEEVEPFIPAEYNEQSRLRAKIEGGKVNVCDFDLRLGKAGR